jgi:hypothetical protein
MRVCFSWSDSTAGGERNTEPQSDLKKRPDDVALGADFNSSPFATNLAGLGYFSFRRQS